MNRKKIIISGIILGIFVGLGIWVWSRWEAWFGQEPEEAYEAPMRPERILLTFGDQTELSRNVSWICDSVVRPSMLELREEGESASKSEIIPAEGEVFRSRSGIAAYYHAKLRRLKRSTGYCYRVISGADTSAWYHFETCDTSRRDSRFLYVGDVQDTINGESREIFREIFRRYPDTEIFISGGDFTERPTDKHWARSLGSLDSICQSVPFMAVAGNHDYLKGVKMKLERRFPLIYSYFLDSEMGDTQVYNLRYGDTEFFLLDSTRDFFSLRRQRLWLDRKLRISKAKWKIVIVHHPLYSIKGSMNNLMVRWMFDDVVRNRGVDLVLQGHEHNYARMAARDEETGEKRTPVYLVTHCSPKNYRIEFDDKRFDKFGIEKRYYQMIRVYGDTLSLATYYTRDHTLCDSLLIVKAGAEGKIVDKGTDIKEYMHYEPRSGRSKERAYKKRVERYCDRHPDRVIR